MLDKKNNMRWFVNRMLTTGRYASAREIACETGVNLKALRAKHDTREAAIAAAEDALKGIGYDPSVNYRTASTSQIAAQIAAKRQRQYA